MSETAVVIFCECQEGEYPQAQFKNFSHGETIWDCQKCGGTILQYNDCLGG
jgi:predicted SprT family Zn-dependent metalloprotease